VDFHAFVLEEKLKQKIIVQLQGGLGNQLFQYFSGVYLSDKLGMEFVIDETRHAFDVSVIKRKLKGVGDGSIKELLDLPESIFLKKSLLSINSVARKIPIYRETFVCATELEIPSVFQPNLDLICDYEFHDKHLRLNVTLQSLAFLNVPQIKDHYNTKISNGTKFRAEFENLMRDAQVDAACAVHVRLGDYITNGQHDLLTKTYYERAFSALSEFDDIENIWLFSDDIQNARKYLPKSITSRISREYGPDDLSTNETLILMAKCKSHIISNSTFSLWSALFSGSNHVVAPKPWFKRSTIDVEMKFPDEWITVQQ
jgi:hypothetical protein